jgi:hypothetical protein
MPVRTRSRPAFNPASIWTGLSTSHPDLLFATLQRFESLAAACDDDRERAIQALIDFEAALPEPELQPFLGVQLRALAALPAEAAQALVTTTAAVLRRQPRLASMRRSLALQHACRDLSPDDAAALEPLLPGACAWAGG